MRYQPFAMCLLLLAVGCSSDDHWFNLSVKNGTNSPLMMHLTKDGPQTEYYWASPEDMVEARVHIVPDQEVGGRLPDLEPGKTASKSLFSGKFPDGAHAMLRIYRGKNLTIHELLNIKPGKDRIDVVLNPGVSPGNNDLIVHDVDGKLVVNVVPPKK